jgi:hypothetical protein
VQGDAAVSEAWLVKLDFERVQTYLFAVPELATMIGANTLIGEVLRGALGPHGFGNREASLPALAAACGAALPGGVDPTQLGVPEQDPVDPLQGNDRDDPRAAWKLGILSRDGGHLHAVFPSREHAVRFVNGARALVGDRLHGLLLSDHLANLSDASGAWETKEEPPEAPEKLGASVADMPQLQVCQVTGQGPAAQRGRRPDEVDHWISASVQERRDAADSFNRGSSRDVLGLLTNPLMERLGLTGQKREVFPSDFEKIAPSGYLAIVAADGNGMGARSKKWRVECASDDFFAREARGEQFFHSMRVAVRKALLEALAETFAPAVCLVREERRVQMPFRLMMLGGDDLLLVCDAPYALPFVRCYAAKLAGHKLAEDDKPLTIGAGVAIVKGKFPFHRSHALAEQLAKSAKRLFRELKEPASVVDWVAISEAWHEDVEEVRRRDFRRSYRNAVGKEETLVLSCKPYPVLNGERLSLERLLAGAEEARGRLPRSQLMALAGGVRHGRLQADRDVRLLDEELRQAMAPVLDGPANARSAWLATRRDGWYRTALLDFLEVYELQRMLHEPEERADE